MGVYVYILSLNTKRAPTSGHVIGSLEFAFKCGSGDQKLWDQKVTPRRAAWERREKLPEYCVTGGFDEVKDGEPVFKTPGSCWVDTQRLERVGSVRRTNGRFDVVLNEVTS